MSSLFKTYPILSFLYSNACCFPVLFLCAFVAEREIPVPKPKMLPVSWVLFSNIKKKSRQGMRLILLILCPPIIILFFLLKFCMHLITNLNVPTLCYMQLFVLLGLLGMFGNQVSMIQLSEWCVCSEGCVECVTVCVKVHVEILCTQLDVPSHFYCYCVSTAVVYSWSLLGWSRYCQCFSGTL